MSTRRRILITERGESMVKKIGIWVLVLGCAFVLLSGCATMKYKRIVPDYEAKVNRLKALGGEQKAPYETAKSELYLETFKKEVAEGDTKGAALFQKKLDEYIEKALMKIP
jgi:hypothetical protein